MKKVYIMSKNTNWTEHKERADNNGEISKYMKRIQVYSDVFAYGRHRDIKRHLKWWWKFHNDPKSYKEILKELNANVVKDVYGEFSDYDFFFQG